MGVGFSNIFWGLVLGAALSFGFGGTAQATPLPRLCEEAKDPDGAKDTRLIHCVAETGSFLKIPGKGKTRIKVASWNIARGYNFKDQSDFFRSHPDLRDADVILLSEADRDCERSGDLHEPKQLAMEMGMAWAYAVEYMEVEFVKPEGPVKEVCEHGNAILSRYPLSNVRSIRHQVSVGHYDNPAKRVKDKSTGVRLGGRVILAADVALPWGLTRVYSLHLENTFMADQVRVKQIKEVIQDAAGFKGPVLLGGDLNTDQVYNDLRTGIHRDPVPKTLAPAGFMDAHAGLPLTERSTSQDAAFGDAIWDMIWIRGLKVAASGVVRYSKEQEGLSDHRPIWTVLKR